MTYTLWHVLLALSISIPLSLQSKRMARVWLVFAASSLAAWTYQSLPFYIAIDLMAATVVLAKPRCAWQKAIGMVMLCMATMTIGFMISEVAHVHGLLSAPPNQDRLWQVYNALSWAELALFFVWGGNDWFFRFARDYPSGSWSVLVNKNRSD
ncbi:MAG: hypothetical protein MJH10_11970 [Epibacterium sp.]|nr:hypothetical protein [Epibacterium sp.]NQX74264.1 hypothetical protein [Epibacterium sp.]